MHRFRILMRNLSGVFIATSKAKAHFLGVADTLECETRCRDLLNLIPWFPVVKSEGLRVKGTRTLVARRRRETVFLCKSELPFYFRHTCKSK